MNKNKKPKPIQKAFSFTEGFEILTRVTKPKKAKAKVAKKIKERIISSYIKDDEISLLDIQDNSIKDLLESCHNDLKRIVYGNIDSVTKFKISCGQLLIEFKNTITLIIKSLAKDKKHYIIKEEKRELVNIIA